MRLLRRAIAEIGVALNKQMTSESESGNYYNLQHGILRAKTQ